MVEQLGRRRGKINRFGQPRSFRYPQRVSRCWPNAGDHFAAADTGGGSGDNYDSQYRRLALARPGAAVGLLGKKIGPYREPKTANRII